MHERRVNRLRGDSLRSFIQYLPRAGQFDGEHCSHLGGARDAHDTAMIVNNLADDREAEASAVGLSAADERIKQCVAYGGGDPRATARGRDLPITRGGHKGG